MLLLGSLGASVVLSKAVVLAGPALLYSVWSPWIRAGVGLRMPIAALTLIGHARVLL